MLTTPVPSLLNADGVRHKYSLARSTVYRLMREAGFPPPIQIAARRVAWRTAEIELWLASRPVAAVKGGVNC